MPLECRNLLTGNSSLTISAGIYSSIAVSGNGKLTMNAGIYVIAGGGFAVSGNGIVTGSGVLICNGGTGYKSGSTPTDGGTYGAIALSGNAQVTPTRNRRV